VAATPDTVTTGFEDSATLTATVVTGNGEVLPSGGPVTVDVGTTSCVATLVPAGTGGAGSCHIGATDLAVSGTRYGISTTYGGSTDLVGSSASAATGLLVVTTPTITTPSLPDATNTQVNYQKTLAVAGGSSPFTWSVSVGILPAGLSLDPSTGRIHGTVSALAETATVTVRAVDGSGASVEKPFTLTVDAVPNITTTTLDTARAGEAGYNQTVLATGGRAALTWSLNGVIPGGLSLDPASGVISGNVHTGASSETFIVTVTDANGVSDSTSLTITVEPTYVQQITIPPAGESSSTYSAVLPGPVGVNDTLVLTVAQACTDGGTPVLSDVTSVSWNGHAFTPAVSNGCDGLTGSTDIWYLVGTEAATAGTSVTVTLPVAADVPYLNVTEYTGVTGLDPAVGATSSGTGTGAAVSPGPVATTGTGDLVVSTAFVDLAPDGTLAAQLVPFLLLNRTGPFLGFGTFLVAGPTAPLGWTYTHAGTTAWAASSAAFTMAP